MTSVFWLFVVVCCYSYFLYPVLLIIFPRRTVSVEHDFKKSNVPHMTVIIAAHNEEEKIADKIRATLAIDYPSTRMEIIVASDCSTDGTDDVVRSFRDTGVQLVQLSERGGKEAAQKLAIEHSTSDILVFSDVATKISSGSLAAAAKIFKEKAVGAISSEDRVISPDGRLVGEGAYVKYEMLLRRLESDRGGLVGLSGSFFLARRAVCEEWDVESPSDFNVAFNCVRKGLVAVSSSDVVGEYQDVRSDDSEYRRKKRTVIRGMTAIWRHSDVLNAAKFGKFSFQVWSHKVMRWIVPWALIGLAAISVGLYGQNHIIDFLIYCQLAFYGIAVLGMCWTKTLRLMPVTVVTYFVKTNVAVADATIAFFRGVRMKTWSPSQR